MAAEAGTKHKADLPYTLVGILLAVVGWVVGTALAGLDPVFAAKAGISVFALVYVLAQAVERLVELTIALVESGAKRLLDKELATTTKAKALHALRTASTPASSVAASTDASGTTPQSTAQKAEADTHALAFGLALLFAFVACGYFEIRLLEMIGVEKHEDWVDRLVSGLIVAGGSKPLHDLISKIQKSKQKDEQTTGAPA